MFKHLKEGVHKTIYENTNVGINENSSRQEIESIKKITKGKLKMKNMKMNK